MDDNTSVFNLVALWLHT